MSTAAQMIVHTRRWVSSWSWLKKGLLIFSLFIFSTSSFLYLTPPGLSIREFLAETVITTQHRDWAWIFVGTQKRDYMVQESHRFTASSATEKQNLDLINIEERKNKNKRSVSELISEPKDVSSQFWKGKMIYVYDPTTIRVVTPKAVGEGERISSMSERTGAVAGINGGGFIDPDGLGNGFAPIGLIMSDFQPIYTDTDDDDPQHIIGFTEDGTLLVGKYSLNELRKINAKEAVSFLAPRLIANGNPQITQGDGGWGRAPRTAIAQKADGTVIFLAIDGRSTSSVGATLKEVQDLLLKEGAINAGLLDGGASTELVLNHQVVTKPSSRYGERRLPSGLLVYDDPSSYKADRVWDGLQKINAGGAFDHPDFLKEQEQLRRKQLQNPVKTPDPSATPTPKASEAVKTPTAPTPTPKQSGSGSSGSGSGATNPGGTTARPESATPGSTGGTGTSSPAATAKPPVTASPAATPSGSAGGTGTAAPVPTPSATPSKTPTPSTGAVTASPTPKSSAAASGSAGVSINSTSTPAGSGSSTATPAAAQ